MRLSSIRPRDLARVCPPARGLLAAGLAAHLALAFTVAPAAAQVVYRRLDFTVPAGIPSEGVVNLVDASTFRMPLGAPAARPSCPGPGCDWDFGLAFGETVNWRVVLPGARGVTTPVTPEQRGVAAASPTGTVQALAPGALVGLASTFNTNEFGTSADPLIGLGEQFIGLRFRNEVGGTVHYAWARIALAERAASATVIDYAFEATPQRAITVGAGLPPVSVVPEPGTVVLVASGLALIARVARRRRAATCS